LHSFSEELAAEALVHDTFGLRGTSLLSMADLSASQMDAVLQTAAALKRYHHKRQRRFGWQYPRSLAMIFEKPSLRTRVTFDFAMRQLGGITTILGPSEIGLGSRESVPDVIRNLDRWCDAVMARVFRHSVLEEMRDFGRVPVINGLSDDEHPCQTLADLLTIREHKGLRPLKLAWVGDGNNVLHSLMIGCAMAGISVAAACPEGYLPNSEIVKTARERAAQNPHQPTIDVMRDPRQAARGADVIYTDVWTSMGQEQEQLQRIRVFREYQVNADLMRLAAADAIFLHCLPAHRGDEVTDEVVDGPQSVVFDEAENRLHAQKAVIALLVGTEELNS
jgi:ornithine carbamoyltransferase